MRDRAVSEREEERRAGWERAHVARAEAGGGGVCAVKRAERRVGPKAARELGRALGCGVWAAGERGSGWARVGSERAARFGVGKRKVGHGPLQVGLGLV